MKRTSHNLKWSLFALIVALTILSAVAVFAADSSETPVVQTIGGKIVVTLTRTTEKAKDTINVKNAPGVSVSIGDTLTFKDRNDTSLYAKTLGSGEKSAIESDAGLPITVDLPALPYTGETSGSVVTGTNVVKVEYKPKDLAVVTDTLNYGPTNFDINKQSIFALNQLAADEDISKEPIPSGKTANIQIKYDATKGKYNVVLRGPLTEGDIIRLYDQIDPNTNFKVTNNVVITSSHRKSNVTPATYEVMWSGIDLQGKKLKIGRKQAERYETILYNSIDIPFPTPPTDKIFVRNYNDAPSSIRITGVATGEQIFIYKNEIKESLNTYIKEDNGIIYYGVTNPYPYQVLPSYNGKSRTFYVGTTEGEINSLGASVYVGIRKSATSPEKVYVLDVGTPTAQFNPFYTINGTERDYKLAVRLINNYGGTRVKDYIEVTCLDGDGTEGKEIKSGDKLFVYSSDDPDEKPVATATASFGRNMSTYGKLIVATLTFPEYLEKDADGKVIDPPTPTKGKYYFSYKPANGVESDLFDFEYEPEQRAEWGTGKILENATTTTLNAAGTAKPELNVLGLSSGDIVTVYKVDEPTFPQTPTSYKAEGLGKATVRKGETTASVILKTAVPTDNKVYITVTKAKVAATYAVGTVEAIKPEPSYGESTAKEVTFDALPTDNSNLKAFVVDNVKAKSDLVIIFNSIPGTTISVYANSTTPSGSTKEVKADNVKSGKIKNSRTYIYFDGITLPTNGIFYVTQSLGKKKGDKELTPRKEFTPPYNN